MNDQYDNQSASYRRTSLRLLIKDMARFKNLETRFLMENSNLTYEKVFVAGMELFESMNEEQLREYIKNKVK